MQKKAHVFHPAKIRILTKANVLQALRAKSADKERGENAGKCKGSPAYHGT